MPAKEQATLEYNYDKQQQQLSLSFTGRLDMNTVGNLWSKALALQSDYSAQHFIVDASKVVYCDSAGVSLFLKLKQQQLAKQLKFELKGLAEQYQRLFNLLDGIQLKTQKSHTEKTPIIAKVGKTAYQAIGVFQENTKYLGELCYESIRCFARPNIVRWKDVWQIIENVGPGALPIILLLGFLMGLILSFQSAIPLQRFGAVIYVANLVGISLTRELGPLLVAIILAGRTASSFAAEIGTMKVNQEVDALKTLGLKPLLFLAIPRVLAVTLMAPLLDIFMIAIALLGSAVFMMSIGYSWEVFIQQLHSAVTIGDMVGGLFKSVIFGMVIAGIGCMHGLRTRFGASAVGDSTTHAVVSCIVMIVVIDGIFAVLFYVLGF